MLNQSDNNCMKLFVSNTDVTKLYVQCKLFARCGSLAVATECKGVLRDYWNQLNSGTVDVQSVDHLYTKLCQCVRLLDHYRAKAHDLSRSTV